MNRSFFLKLTALMLAVCLFASPALADGYTIDEALKLVGTEEGRANGGKLLLTDDFSRFDVYNEEYFTPGDGKTIILWREAPEKAYTPSDVEFEADFTGEDVGEPKVYLCAELMERIPEDQRATTFAEADHILMAEVIYELTGVMWTSESPADSEMPSQWKLAAILLGTEADATEAEIEAEQEGVYVYHPLFGCTVLTALYNTQTLGASFIDWIEYPYAEMRANPSADDYWQEMLMLIEILRASGLEDEEAAFYTMSEILFYWYDLAAALTDEEWNQLVDLVYGEDMAALQDYCWNKFWEMAPLLGELDPDCVSLYNQAIKQQSLEGLAYIVNTRNYSGVDMEDEDILSKKAYIGTPDLDVLDRMLLTAVSDLEYYDWDMAELYDALIGG